MATIRIVSTPPGDGIPDSIRSDWVGVEIPNATKDDGGLTFHSEENKGGYIVIAQDAVAALREAGHHGAANFWESVMPSGNQLRFGEEHCEII